MTLAPVEDGPGPDARGTPDTGSGGRLPYISALDGLRGVAVAAVLCFHAGFEWAEGGFLGVSTFFTLSGFLITSLLLAERQHQGGIDLRRFWVRRVRRLMPASFAAIALALAYGALAADPLQRQELAGDVIASLAYVANWWFLASGQSYGELFVAPSPLLHFWSLAIEEQFYLVFPVLAWAVLGRAGWGRRRFGAVLVALTLASVALPFVTSLSNDAVYYATPTRAAELLIGALLAVVLHHRHVIDRLAGDRRAQTAVSSAGVAALVVCVGLWATTAQGDDWLYHGGFAAYALLSALVVLGALLPGGPLELVLGTAPLVHLGRTSYGVYVYHWPLFLWIDERRTGLEGWPLFGLRLAATLALAEASYRLLEQPVRHGERLGPMRPRVLIAPVGATLVAIALLLSSTAPPPTTDFAGAEQRLAALEGAPTDDDGGGLSTATAPPPLPPPDPAATEPPAPRMTVYGDSTALMTAFGLETWIRNGGSPGVSFVPGIARLGCGVGRGGERMRANDVVEPVEPHCNDWARTWGEKVKVFAPNLVVVQVGPWETMDRRIPGDDTWRHPGDPVYDAWLLGEMTEAVDVLSADGAAVVWLTAPAINDNVDRTGDFGRPETRDPARMQRLNELIGQLPDRRPGRVAVVDLAGWLAQNPRDGELRSDGVHFDNDVDSSEVAQQFLGPAVVEAYRQLWRDDAAGRQARQAAAAAASPPVVGPDAGAPARLLVWGDRTARPIGDALAAWGETDGRLEVTTVVRDDCGVTRPDVRRVAGTDVPLPEDCRDRTELHDAVAAIDPHVVLVVPGVWETADQLVAGEPMVWVALNGGVYDDWARAELGEVADELHDDDRAVLWLSSPAMRIDGDPAGDLERVVRLNQLLAELVASRSRAPWSGVVDLAAESQRWPGGPLAPEYRPDGVALSPQGAAAMAPWLGAEVLARLDALAQPAPPSPDGNAPTSTVGG